MNLENPPIKKLYSEEGFMPDLLLLTIPIIILLFLLRGFEWKKFGKGVGFPNLRLRRSAPAWQKIVVAALCFFPFLLKAFTMLLIFSFRQALRLCGIKF